MSEPKCKYCGGYNNGDRCKNCGAPNEDPRRDEEIWYVPDEGYPVKGYPWWIR